MGNKIIDLYLLNIPLPFRKISFPKEPKGKCAPWFYFLWYFCTGILVMGLFFLPSVHKFGCTVERYYPCTLSMILQYQKSSEADTSAFSGQGHVLIPLWASSVVAKPKRKVIVKGTGFEFTTPVWAMWVLLFQSVRSITKLSFNSLLGTTTRPFPPKRRHWVFGMLVSILCLKTHMYYPLLSFSWNLLILFEAKWCILMHEVHSALSAYFLLPGAGGWGAFMCLTTNCCRKF